LALLLMLLLLRRWLTQPGPVPSATAYASSYWPQNARRSLVQRSVVNRISTIHKKWLGIGIVSRHRTVLL